jgi:isoleucyl-tRNA synthetase
MDDSLFVKFKLEDKFDDKDVYIMVWTTTPWTLPSNYTLCIGPNIRYVLLSSELITNTETINETTTETTTNYYILAENLIEKVFGPNSEKNKITIIRQINVLELVGLKYEPLFNFVFDYVNTNSDNNFTHKIICGDFVTDSDGTGIVHIAPAYGADDYNVCTNNKLINKESKIFQPLDPNGFVSELILECQGMFYKNQNNKLADKNLPDFNTWVIKQLKTKGSYYDKRQIKHNYPFCWRSDTPLIYKSTTSWFVKVQT